MKHSSPLRKMMARKPSHLGSNRNPSAAGSSSAILASIGSMGGVVAAGVDEAIAPFVIYNRAHPRSVATPTRCQARNLRNHAHPLSGAVSFFYSRSASGTSLKQGAKNERRFEVRRARQRHR